MRSGNNFRQRRIHSVIMGSMTWLFEPILVIITESNLQIDFRLFFNPFHRITIPCDEVPL